jgi:hypothetical protein
MGIAMLATRHIYKEEKGKTVRVHIMKAYYGSLNLNRKLGESQSSSGRLGSAEG